MTSTLLERPAQSRKRSISAHEYWQMAEFGFFIDQRVELIGGEIIEVSPQTNWHGWAISSVGDALKAAFDSGRYWVRTQTTLELSPLSCPEPDIAVVLGSLKSWRKSRKNPATAELVVEVSDSSLAEDRKRKSSLYAAAGIPEFWILNIPDSQLEVRRDPIADASQEFGFGYSSLAILKAGEFATPLAVPEAKIAVAELLPE